MTAAVCSGPVSPRILETSDRSERTNSALTALRTKPPAAKAGINQSPDEVGEMKFDVDEYDASIGHTLGVTVTATTKAGTNDLHGAVRETYTPQRWEALNHFSGLNYRYQQALAGCVNGATTSPECYAIENTYGNPGNIANNGDAAIGGPVFVPKVYDGHNRFFFFVSIIDDVLADAGAGTASIPTIQERGGDFSDFANLDPHAAANTPANWSQLCPGGQPYYGEYQLYNPYSTALTGPNGTPSRAPICGNVIPASLLANSDMTKFYNALLPTPTSNNPLGNNYTYTQISPQTFRSYTTREDFKVTSKDNIFVRYTRQDYTKTINDWSVNDVGEQQGPRWIDVPAIGWNHIFSSRTNLNVTFGGTNFKTHCCFYPNLDKYTPASLGLPSYTTDYAQGAQPELLELPVISISSYNGVGQTDNVPNTTRSFALQGNLVHVMGRHTIRAGVEWRSQNTAQAQSGNVSGTYNFDDTYTQQNNGTNPIFQQTNTGLSYAAFLMGVDTSASVNQIASQSFHSPYYAGYVDDTWRLSPKLTVIPGLRYEWEAGVQEKHNQLITGWNFNADLSSISGPANSAYQASLAAATPGQLAVLPTSLTIAGGPQYAGVNGAPKTEWQNSSRFLPRIAVAYQIKPKVVIRGGYGLFFDTMNALNLNVDQDGFSASTTVPSSPTGLYGTNFNNGVSPLTDPFPANANGARFNTPIGASAGALYYLGSSPGNISVHNLVPARENRGSIGVQWQLGSSTMIDASYSIADTSHLSIGKNYTFTPSSFYTGGQQPNSAAYNLLNTTVPNPFLLSNFSGVASSNPAAYNMMSLNSFFTSPAASIGSLVRPYQQLNGLNLNEALGQSHFQEVLITINHRYNHGLTLMGSLQINDQHDRDYFLNGFDPLPSWEPTNASVPTRLTVEEVWALPFGHGRAWLNSGWKNAIFGGYQVSSSYEAQPGMLVNFGNMFYSGQIKASAIKIKQPVYVNGLSSGGYDYVQWLNPGRAVATAVTTNNITTCSYSGTGFVTNPSCQPNGYNLTVFPTRVNGVRQMGMNGMNATVARTFHIWERTTLETSLLGYNVFNHQILSSPNTSPTSSNFGQVTSDGWPNSSGRWLSIQGRFRF